MTVPVVRHGNKDGRIKDRDGHKMSTRNVSNLLRLNLESFLVFFLVQGLVTDCRFPHLYGAIFRIKYEQDPPPTKIRLI